MKYTLILSLCVLSFLVPFAHATSNYEYGTDEYVTIADGIAPNGKYAITTHGGGPYGYEHFHVYLTDAVTGRKVGPLEKITETLDTGAGAFCAYWTLDSGQVTITYRISRHEPLKVVSYRIANRHAYLITGPDNATDEQTKYWGAQCSTSQPSERVFGTAGQR